MPNLSVGDWVSLHSLRNEIATACVKPRNDELKIATGHGPRNDEKMKSVMKPYVYILTNINKTVLYTGVTADLRKRVLEHRNGVGSQFTRRYNLQTVVYAEEHPTMMSAIAREKQIKSWSRRRKEELIGELNPGWQDLMPIDC